MFWRDFGGVRVRSKSIVPSSIKVAVGNHSHIIRSDTSEVAVTRSTTADDLNLQEWSWSHKLESLCCSKSKERKSSWIWNLHMHGRISKLLHEVEIDLGLNLL